MYTLYNHIDCSSVAMRRLYSLHSTHLIWARCLIRSVGVTEVLVGLCALGLGAGTVRTGLVDGRDIVAQGDGLHSLVDATAHTLTHLGPGWWCLTGRRRAGTVAIRHS